MLNAIPRRFARLVAATLMGLVALMPGATAGGELVVMPYLCHVERGLPVLTPTENRSHRILSRRDTENFTVCAPGDPGQCRRWQVHRFDMDCGGRPVAWVDVVAASTQPRQAFVEDGIFHIRMPKWWGQSDRDECFSPRANERWRPGLMRYCAERRARGEQFRRNTVALPPGFAPLFGIDAIFLNAPAVPSPPRPATAPTSPTNPLAERREPRPEKTVPETHASRTGAAEPNPAPTVANPTRAANPGTTTPPAPPLAAAPTATQPPQAATASAGTSPSPDGITAASPKPQPVTLNTPATTTPIKTSKLEPAPGLGQSYAGLPPRSEPTPVNPTPPAVSARSGVVPGLSNRDALVAAVAASLLLAGLGLLIVALRRGGGSPELEPADRDLGAIRLDDGPANGFHAAGSNLAPHGTKSASPAVRLAPALNDGSVPTSPEEALHVLGLGPAPDADLVAIKRLVDALRFNWHPDRADGDPDRKLREQRLQQINVAWDILSARGGPDMGGRPA
jgi:hypothetical protein